MNTLPPPLPPPRARPLPPPIPTPMPIGDPAQWAALLGIPLPTNSLPVTSRTLLGLPAAYAAVTKIANAAATMLRSADVLDDGRALASTPLVVRRPNFGYGPFTFWKEVLTTAMIAGNWIGINIAPDEDGYPTQVVPVPPSLVGCTINPYGFVEYEIAGTIYGAESISHVRIGVTEPGNPWCIGVIEAHRRGLTGALALQGMSNEVAENGAVPSGVVQLDTPEPTAAQVNGVKTAWIGALGGKRTVAVIGNKMNYTPVTWNSDDAQFLESRQFTVAETALMFGLRPEDLGATIGGSSLTYGNRTDDALQRITDAYMPVVMPVEETWADLLPEHLTVKANAEALLRSSTKERYEIHQLAQQIGLQDVDETREIEGRPPRQAKPTTQPEPSPPAGDDATTDDQADEAGEDDQ